MKGLHVFGYTARMDDAIADALRSLARDAGWSRFAMRFTNAPFPLRSTVTIESVRQKPAGAVVVPGANRPHRVVQHVRLVLGDGKARRLSTTLKGMPDMSPTGKPSLQLEFNKRLHELSVDILQQTVSFAASIAEELDELIESSPECQPGRSATFYPRIFALGPQKSSWTHTNQFTLALGASSFFLYAVDWLLFKRNDEVLRAAIFDPLLTHYAKY